MNIFISILNNLKFVNNYEQIFLIVAGFLMIIFVFYKYSNKKKGLIMGKFYPFHNGHKYLIETGLKRCDFLVVILVYKNTENIPYKSRYDMVYKTFENEILNGRMKLICRENKWDNDNDSKFWADLAIKWLDGNKPQIVFTSEKYGEPWATYIGCEHYLCDLSRIRYNVSGTVVRNDPSKYWKLLPIATQDYYMNKK